MRQPHAIQGRQKTRPTCGGTRGGAVGAGAKLLAFSLGAFLAADTAFATSTPYLGEIVTLGGNYCPQGFLPTNGQVISIAENDDLFSLIGTTYGGNGQTTFALPALPPTRTATGAPLLFCIAMFGIYPSRD